jgi:hypothetical protein
MAGTLPEDGTAGRDRAGEQAGHERLFDLSRAFSNRLRYPGHRLKPFTPRKEFPMAAAKKPVSKKTTKSGAKPAAKKKGK